MIDMSDSQSLYRVYVELLGGSIPAPDGVDPTEVVANRALALLDTSAIHLATAVRNGTCYYLAVPTSALAGFDAFESPLVSALPGGEADRGDGAYLYTFMPFATALVRDGEQMRVLVSSEEEVRLRLQSENVAIFDLMDEDAKPLRARGWWYRSAVSKIGKVASYSALAVLGLSAVTLVVAKGVSGYYASRSGVSKEAYVHAAENAMRKLTLISPLAARVERINKIAAATVATGGWVDAYSFDATNGEKFVLSMPSWVTADAIKDLGPRVTTHRNVDEGTVWVVQRGSDGRSIKGFGPVDVAEVGGAAVKASPTAAAQQASVPVPMSRQ